MKQQWNQKEIQRYIDNGTEESLTLEYKAAASIDKSPQKKKEITKDVSSMANSAGGFIIYGVKEYDDPSKKHKPEAIDGIDRQQFPKEWLEDVINNVHPHISGLLIHQVDMNTDSNKVIYVVEIPQSNTAHQATDYRYYKRFNFKSAPMEDYEVRDVMNRGTTPDVSVEFRYRLLQRDTSSHEYLLVILIKNNGVQMISHFKLEFTFPKFLLCRPPVLGHKQHIDFSLERTSNYLVTYRSKEVLFPKEELDISRDIELVYKIDYEVLHKIKVTEETVRNLSLSWTLYADNMPVKYGQKLISELYNM